MQSDWKIKQEIYHRLNNQHDDDLSLHPVEMSEDIVGSAVRYFSENTQGWVYPAKSYVVAICYARWLSEQYGGGGFEYLEDPDLLYGNDPYFVTYSTDPLTYHNILNNIGSWSFDETIGIIPDVRKYFEEEFML
jgi:hypothetical protein